MLLMFVFAPGSAPASVRAGRRAAGRRAGGRIDQTGEQWFAEDQPVRQVHRDSSMFIGGIRALLLQSLHPLAMAAVARHSDYRGDHKAGCSGPAFSWPSPRRPGRMTPRRRSRGSARSTGTSPAPDPTGGRRRLRPAPAHLGAHRRGGRLPARPQPVRRPAPRSGRTRWSTSPTWPGSAPRWRARPARTEAEARRPDRPVPGQSSSPPPRRARQLQFLSTIPRYQRSPALAGVLAAAAVSLLPGWQHSRFTCHQLR